MKTPAALLVAALAAALLGGCAVTEQDPLSVNGARASPTAGSVPGQPTQGGVSEDAPAGTDWGEDPLNIRAGGAILCGVQPRDSFQQYTVMLHNPTLEIFTFSNIHLGSPEGLRIVSAEIAPANKEGHAHHGGGPGAAGLPGHDSGHGAAPAPAATSSEPSTFQVKPVPASGYAFEPGAHINIVVEVALEDQEDSGTAENIVIDFSSPARSYTVAHPLEITIDRHSCT